MLNSEQRLRLYCNIQDLSHLDQFKDDTVLGYFDYDKDRLVELRIVYAEHDKVNKLNIELYEKGKVGKYIASFTDTCLNAISKRTYDDLEKAIIDAVEAIFIF